MAEPSHPEPPIEDFYMAALWDAARPAAMVVPGYTILGEISRGGMGVVYHAEQLRPKREVALKVLMAHLAEEPEMVARFHLEARAMAALDHAGILPVYEVGEADGAPFFSMKLATGGTLADRLLMGRFKPKEAAALMIQLARAVHHAHQHGVLHRDLKPGNFLFLEDGSACVSDFGLAKLSVPDERPLTRTQSFFGTPHYMPPEVAAGSVANATVAGDLYSMGAVFYECLTGKRPHPVKDSVAAQLRAIADEPVIPLLDVVPDLPRDLSVICLKALQRNPADRYATLEDFAEDIERWKEGRPIKARPAGVFEIAWRWAKRHPLPAGLAVALSVVMLTGAILLAVSYQEQRQRLHRSLIEQGRSERLLGAPGHRERALAYLRQADALAPSPEIRDETAALLARPDFSPIPFTKPSLAEPWRPENVTTWQPARGGLFGLATDDSGEVTLWRKDAKAPLRSWLPLPGNEIAADFTPDNNIVVVAGTSDGVIAENLTDPGSPTKVLAGPGPVVRFLTIDPKGHRLALARVDGLEVMPLENPGTSWHFGEAPARCAAAWSADGLRVAAAVGDRREAAILAADTGGVCATAAVTGSPQALAFHPDGTLLAVASDDGVIAFCEAATGHSWTTLRFAATSLAFSADGKELRATGADGITRAWAVSLPTTFHEWSELPRAKQDGAVLDMALSPDVEHLLTVSSGCIAIWSVPGERQTGYHLLENQRIDVRASAWWLNNHEILIQVPGGLERLTIDPTGKPGASVRVPKVPGSTVRSVLPNGGWIVSVADEDGTITFELWPNGNSNEAIPAIQPQDPDQSITATHPRTGQTATLSGEDTIRVTNPDGSQLQLVCPLSPGVRALKFPPGGRTIFVLTRLHRVFSWRLSP